MQTIKTILGCLLFAYVGSEFLATLFELMVTALITIADTAR